MIDLRVVHTAALWATSASLAAVPPLRHAGREEQPQAAHPDLVRAGAVVHVDRPLPHHHRAPTRGRTGLTGPGKIHP